MDLKKNYKLSDTLGGWFLLPFGLVDSIGWFALFFVAFMIMNLKLPLCMLISLNTVFQRKYFLLRKDIFNFSHRFCTPFSG